MTKEQFIGVCTQYTDNAPENRIGPEIAITPEFSGVRIFDEPIFGFADASDPMFESLRKPEAVGGCHMLPDEWLGGAKSVISFFCPLQRK